VNGRDEGDDRRDERLRRGSVRGAPPVLRPAGESPPVSIDSESGTVQAVAVVGGPAAGAGRRVILRFSWQPADPLAVLIDIETRPDHPALPRGSWVVLRDFLRYGLTQPTGDGEVRIAPRADGIELTLARSQRPCVVIVPAATLGGFLDRTETAVPLGAERSDALVDALVERLLADSRGRVSRSAPASARGPGRTAPGRSG
jgi:hypothetical protein